MKTVKAVVSYWDPGSPSAKKRVPSNETTLCPFRAPADVAGQLVHVAFAWPDWSAQLVAPDTYVSPTSQRTRSCASGIVTGQPDLHALPWLPHVAEELAVWHVPLPSQQPFGQLAGVHTHWPPLQVCPGSQALPHPLQFLLSVCSLTHALPHRLWLPVQAMAQAFASQVAVPCPWVGPGQLVPQRVPQLFGSLLSAQAVPQACAPGAHA